MATNKLVIVETTTLPKVGVKTFEQAIDQQPVKVIAAYNVVTDGLKAAMGNSIATIVIDTSNPLVPTKTTIWVSPSARSKFYIANGDYLATLFEAKASYNLANDITFTEVAK
jgi:predicted dinucleotide-binding enzyme